MNAGYVPELEILWQEWQAAVIPFLESAGLEIPIDVTPVADSRHVHTEHLDSLLSVMQAVARLDPTASW